MDSDHCPEEQLAFEEDFDESFGIMMDEEATEDATAATGTVGAEVAAWSGWTTRADLFEWWGDGRYEPHKIRENYHQHKVVLCFSKHIKNVSSNSQCRLRNNDCPLFLREKIHKKGRLPENQEKIVDPNIPTQIIYPVWGPKLFLKPVGILILWVYYYWPPFNIPNIIIGEGV